MIFGMFGGEKKRVAELISAARTGDSAKLQALLEKGVDINAQEPESGDTALLAAIDKGQWAAAEYLLKQRPDLALEDVNGQSPLYLAVSRGDPALPMVNLLLKAGALVDLGPKQGDNAGATPLHVACATGANACLEALIAHGASAVKQRPDGSTPLHTAAIGGDQQTVELLCKAGASVAALNDDKRTPLHTCGITGNAKVAAALIQQGAVVDGADAEGCTPLMRAVMKNHAEVARVVLDHGANPDVVAQTGDTPLYPLFIAAMYGYDDVVRVLLAKGVNVTAKVPGSVSPVDAAKHNGHEAAAKLIAAAIKRKKAAEKDASAAAKEAETHKGTSGGSKRNTAVELGVLCCSIRYDEYEHGKQLSKLFSKARAEWVKSKNDCASPNYAKACKLLSEWFTIEYRVRVGFSMSLGLNEDNEINRVADVGAVKDSSEAVDRAFADEPRLKSFEVVSVDFRTHTTHHPLKDNEKLDFSPQIGALAIYLVKPGRKLGSPQELQEFLGGAGALLSSCFSIQVKDEAIQTVEVDQDGDEFTSVSSSYSGGDIELEVNSLAAKDFRDRLIQRAREAGKTPSLLGDAVPEPKRVLMLGDEVRLQRLLEDGLPVDTKVDDETLLKLALMLAATASTWFEHQELSDLLRGRFSSAEDYCAAVRRMALDLLDRGADVNAMGGSMSVLSLAETLNDPDILTICRARADSVDDASSTPLLLAAERGDEASLRELLDRGARINKRYLETGVTALMLACQGPDGEDAPPLAGVQLAHQEAAVRLLIERGARLDARSDRGDTAIGNAVRRGNTSIVQMLLDAGAKTTDALPNGQDLMDMARERGHEPVMDVLAAAARGSTKISGRRGSENAQPEHERADSLGLELLAAALSEQHELAKSLLGRGANPMATDEKGTPAFLVPALTDNVEMQRVFLQAGISPSMATAPGGVTALMVAAVRGSRDLCDVLLDAGAEIDQLMASGEPFFSHPNGLDFEMPALGCAADAQKWAMAAHLLIRGATPSFGAMHTDIALTLAKFAPVSLVDQMHQSGYSIVMDHEFKMLFAPAPEMQLPQMRSKVVFWAAVNPDPAVLAWVLAHGGNPLAGNSLNMTPLIVASAVGNTALVEQLLSKGADPYVQDCDGDTALSLAVERGHKGAAAVLKSHMAATQSADHLLLTLHQAAARGDLCAILDRLDQGDSPNLRDDENCTAIMRAVEAGQVAALRLLFAVGGSVRPRNTRGESAWDLGQQTLDQRIRVSLKEFNADDPKRTDQDERFDAREYAMGRFAHPFKFPSRFP